MTPGLQTRQYLQEKVIDVAAYLHRVRAVDEQDVTRVELGKKFQVDVLNLCLNQRLQGRNTLLLRRSSRGNGSMQISARGLVFGSSLAEHERRKTAAHFDDPPWLKVADHTVSN